MNGPQSGLTRRRYAWNFTKALAKDNRFWARFGAVFSGANLLAQGLVGGLCVFSPPLAASLAHYAHITALTATGLASMPLVAQAGLIAGSAALIGIGLTSIGFGFPGAWKRLEHLCEKTFPKFNPLRALRQPFRARRKNNIQKTPQQKKRKNPIKEHHMDVFLSGVTLEGAAVAVAAWSTLIGATLMAPISAVGYVGIAFGTWSIGLCTFDIFNSTKTLFQAYRTHKQERKARRKAKATAKTVKPLPLPPLKKEETKALPAATTAFNKEARQEKYTATPKKSTHVAPQRVTHPPKPKQ